MNPDATNPATNDVEQVPATNNIDTNPPVNNAVGAQPPATDSMITGVPGQGTVSPPTEPVQPVSPTQPTPVPLMSSESPATNTVSYESSSVSSPGSDVSAASSQDVPAATSLPAALPSSKNKMAIIAIGLIILGLVALVIALTLF